MCLTTEPWNCTTQEQFVLAATYFTRYCSATETKCHIVGSENVSTLKHLNVNSQDFSCHCPVLVWLANGEWHSLQQTTSVWKFIFPGLINWSHNTARGLQIDCRDLRVHGLVWEVRAEAH